MDYTCVFGPSPDKFYLGAGRASFCVGMNFLKSYVDNTRPRRTHWISVDKDFKSWVAQDIEGDVMYSSNLNSEIKRFVDGSDDSQGNISFLSFACSSDVHYFIKFTSEGAWHGAWPHANDDAKMLRQKIPNFDNRIRIMLFGKDGTKIWAFDEGFVYSLGGEASKDGHPLKKILDQFSETEFGTNVWTLAPGSSLSSCDSQHYFLRFKRVDSTSSGVRQAWNLPQEMAEKIEELDAFNSSAEEQAALEAADMEDLANLRERLAMQSQIQAYANRARVQAAQQMANAAALQAATINSAFASMSAANF